MPIFHLSKDDFERIHSNTLDILENVGLKIKSKTGLEIFEKAGAAVDHQKFSVKIPSELVEEALKKAPKTVELYARNPKFNITLDKRRVHISTDGTGTSVVDFETGKLRMSKAEDVANTAKIANALDSIHIYWATVGAQDYHPHLQDLYELDAAVGNTEKHVQHSATNLENAYAEIEIGAAIAGGREELRKRPIFSMVVDPVSPLQYDQTGVETTLVFAGQNIPIAVLGVPLAGATSPVTLAGTLTVNNAEVLAGITLLQLFKPGLPVIYGCSSSILDMKTGGYAGGSPESALINAAAAGIAHHYDLPAEVCGFCSESKVLGMQTAYEKLLTGLITAASGADLIIGLGLIEGSKTLVYEQMIIDGELSEMVLRGVRGIEVNYDTLALDLIKKVGPGGNFLAEKHTMQFLTREQWIPKLSDRRSRMSWEKLGSRDVRDTAKEKVREILASHEPQPLEEDVRGKIVSIIKERRPSGG